MVIFVGILDFRFDVGRKRKPSPVTWLNHVARNKCVGRGTNENIEQDINCRKLKKKFMSNIGWTVKLRQI